MVQMRHKHVLSSLVIVLFYFSQIIYANGNVNDSSPSSSLQSSKHFVLVHGSCHGAWSWYKIMALLRSAGHSVTALDLGASGIDSQQAKNVLSSMADFFLPLTDFMGSLPENEKVILVAHSFGGLAVSHSMEMFPEKISVAVFVAALMPGPSLNSSALDLEFYSVRGSLLDSQYTFDNGPKKPPTTMKFGPIYLATHVYQQSPIQDLVLATLTVRSQPLYGAEEKSRQLNLTVEKYGSVKRIFIVSEKDKAIPRDFQRWMIKKNPPHRALEIRGSDHMVMMSKPVELLVHLLGVIEELA